MTDVDIATITVSIVSAAISAMALIVSIVTWRKAHRESRYDPADTELFELLKLELEHPEFRSDEWCANALVSSDPAVHRAYEIFAMMIWNYLEGLYERFGEKELAKGSFAGVIRDFGGRHMGYLKFGNNATYYDADFRKFVEKVLEENPPT